MSGFVPPLLVARCFVVVVLLGVKGLVAAQVPGSRDPKTGQRLSSDVLKH